MSTETFELHAFRNGRWDVLEKFGPGEKASAIASAQRTIAADSAEAVRVVREAFDDGEGVFKQKTVYRFGENREAEGRGLGGASWMDVADAQDPAAPRPEHPPFDLGHLVDAYGGQAAIALGGAAVAAVAAAWGWAHVSGAVGGIGFAAAAASFVGVFVALLYVIRPSSLGEGEAPGRAWVGAGPEPVAAPEEPDYEPQPASDPYEAQPVMELHQYAPTAHHGPTTDPHADADVESLLSAAFPTEWEGTPPIPEDAVLARLFALGAAAQAGADLAVTLTVVNRRVGTEDPARTPEQLRELIDAEPKARDVYALGAEEMRRFHIGEPLLGALVGMLTPPSTGPTAIAVLTTGLTLVSAPRGLGPAAAQRLAEAHGMVVGAVVKARNGHVVKQKSSGVVAVFDRPGAALDAAVMIQRQCQAYNVGSPPPHMGVRIGVATGAASVEQGEYLGEAVRLSAQLAQAAALAEILIDSSTVAAVASGGHRLLDNVAVQPARAMRPAEATEDIPVCPVRWSEDGRRREPAL